MSDVRDRLAAMLADRDDVVTKQMFGATGFMVSGKLAVAANPAGELLVRVGAEGLEGLLTRPGAAQARMGERTMGRGWVMVEARVVADESELRFWLEEALRHNAARAAGR